ncbi:MAG TPA: FIST N-terminal domain-containing protein, partial [Longimicrobiaceae bacterium]|nr:FIST N-terminal domain-containing protein [Longimicrobiaceae bacterium]
MANAAVASTHETGARAGEELGARLREQLSGTAPDAVIVFASPQQDHRALLRALREACDPGVVVGCSSAGEFTSEESGVGLSCAVGLAGDDMRFAACLGRGLRTDRTAAAEAIVAGFRGLDAPGFRHRSALVLTDALAGFADDLVDR